MAQESYAGIDLDMGADAVVPLAMHLPSSRPPRAWTSSRVKARLAAAVWRTASATVPSEIWQRSRMHIAGAGRGGFHPDWNPDSAGRHTQESYAVRAHPAGTPTPSGGTPVCI